jgi:2-amino-4-hydroxy-6-hydroxymethyldihydropteridine diphosphokinase
MPKPVLTSQLQAKAMMRKMHKNLANLNLDDLKKYLSLIREKLAVLGEIQLSTAFQNPDFTATPELSKPDYTNQCVYLTLTSAMTLQQLQQTFKQFESDCGRQRSSESIKNPMKIVTMDIDILLIKLDDEKNSLSKKWIVMADRYPFKAHERAGIEELVLNSYSKD